MDEMTAAMFPALEPMTASAHPAATAAGTYSQEQEERVKNNNQ